MTTLNKDALAPVLGKLVSGLYIVSLKAGDKDAGFLASWVQQAGFEPPMLTIAFNKGRSAHLDLLKESKNAVVNIMAKENSKTMSAFFKAPPEEGSVFDALDTKAGENGVPVLNDSLGYMECTYKAEMASEDHIVVLMEITAGKINNSEIQPSTHIRPDGFKY